MRRFTNTNMLILLAGLAASAFAGATDQALEAFDKGDYAKTVELAKSAKSGDEDFAKLAYLRGEAHLRLEQWAEAATAFQAVLAARPEASPALSGLGKSLAAQGQDAAAEKQLTAAVKADPKDAQAHLALGEFLLNRQRAADAVRALRKANSLAPKDPLVTRALVSGLLGVDKKEKEAQKVADKLAKALPKHPMGHFLRGLVLDRRDKDDDAILAYEKAIDADDTFIDAHKNLAILCTAKNPLYRDRERTEKAFAHYQKYFELGGKDAELEQTYKTIKSFLDGMK